MRVHHLNCNSACPLDGHDNTEFERLACRPLQAPPPSPLAPAASGARARHRLPEILR